jgi:hypothetical protein
MGKEAGCEADHYGTGVKRSLIYTYTPPIRLYMHYYRLQNKLGFKKKHLYGGSA